MVLKHNIIFVLIFLLAKTTLAQTLKGMIKDQDNNLLFGATIYNSINLKSTISDENGKFSIESTTGKNKLIISYVGYTPKILNVNGSTTNRKFSVFIGNRTL